MTKQWPKVLVVGRPNVGKSTFVNRVIGKNKAITFPEPGVTRDILHYETAWQGYPFMLLDSGGVFLKKSQDMVFQSHIEELVEATLSKVTKIIFLVDYARGLDPIDMDIAKQLRRLSCDVLVVVNKCDGKEQRQNLHEFFKLGLGDPIGVSAMNGQGLKHVLDQVVQGFTLKEASIGDSQLEKPRYRIAIVGRPNAGKSTLLNALLNEDRALVSDVAGTTRDSVDAVCHRPNEDFIFVDTAGMRKQAKVDDGVEYYSVLRAKKAIELSDVVVVVLDVVKGLSAQDKRIINLVLDAQKPMIVFVNKWDCIEATAQKRDDLLAMMQHDLPSLENFPFIFGSAKEKKHIGKLFSMIPDIVQRSNKRISTAELNIFIQRVVRHTPPPAKDGKHVKIYYATQVDIHPPVFVFFVNHPKYVTENYKRFLERKLRDYFELFDGISIVLSFKTTDDTGK